MSFSSVGIFSYFRVLFFFVFPSFGRSQNRIAGQKDTTYIMHEVFCLPAAYYSVVDEEKQHQLDDHG